ncbi:MAG TPA: twin-arginine translocase TatA/TatE family subunit [Pyrinomonadaceae bacterium]|nr:twin-arginine translocase TatA/TatE family subunit [Pyrinomonadaceae bacterium]
MSESLFNPLLLFIFDSPVQWMVVIAAISLLFGANKLPELAKSIGKAKKEFKKGMLEADEEEKPEVKPNDPPVLANLDDEALLNEIRRRQAKQLEQNTSN